MAGFFFLASSDSKNSKTFAKFISTQKTSYFKRATPIAFFTDVGKCRGNCSRVVQKEDVFEVIWRQEWVPGDKEVFFIIVHLEAAMKTEVGFIL